MGIGAPGVALLLLLPLLPLLSVAAPVAAQSLATRITATVDGTARIAFAAREGVCGDGRSIYLEGRTITFSARSMNVSTWDWSDDRDVVGSCGDSGSVVRVALRVIDRRVTSVRLYVGGSWRPDPASSDLGVVRSRDAADYLVSLIQQSEPDGASQAIIAATIADSAVVWPRLLAVAKDSSRSRRMRETAIYWLAEAAGDKVAPELRRMAEDDNTDRKTREQAVFALSQMPKSTGVPLLIDIVKTNRDPGVRKTALFWLGQSRDPRAIELFEEILRR